MSNAVSASSAQAYAQQQAHTLACVILAAGKGTRMKSDLPKVLHAVAGQTMVGHVLAAANALQPERVVVVVGPDMETVAQAVAPHRVAVQTGQKGTGDAVRAALPALNLEQPAATVLVLYGDTPLITSETLRKIVTVRQAADNPAVVVLGMRPADPTGYGRLLRDSQGRLQRIVEHLDASLEERAETLCNGGLMAFDGTRMATLLGDITDLNAKGEFYLTDAVAAAVDRGWSCRVVEGPEDEVLGVNSRIELAVVERLMQARLRRRAMEQGATLTDPDSVFFSIDTRLGRDVIIGPQVIFAPGVEIADRVTIKSFCHLEGVRVAEGAVIGPFARLRPGAQIGPEAHIGNFVEIKKATIEAGAKVNHLTYIGDARVGAKANIGAGTITCNYDGVHKHHTDIGAGAFIGSNTALVAPVRVGDGALVGAGSVITEDVPAEALAVARGPQRTIPGGAQLVATRRPRKGGS